MLYKYEYSINYTTSYIITLSQVEICRSRQTSGSLINMSDEALSNVDQGKVSLIMAVELELDDLSGPFQPKPFYDSMLQVYRIADTGTTCS